MQSKIPCLTGEIRWIENIQRDVSDASVRLSLENPLLKLKLETEFNFAAVNINGIWFLSEKLLPPAVRESLEKQWAETGI